MVDATERLQVLLAQEASTYRTTDYLTRIHEQQQLNGESLVSKTMHADMEWEEQCAGPDSSSDHASSTSSSPKKRKSSWDDDEVDVGAEERGPSSDLCGRQGQTDVGSSSSFCSTAPSRSAAAGRANGNGGNHSSASTTSSNSSLINKHWREKICEWAYQVVDHFDLNREVVSIAMNHLDRYLGSYEGTVDKNLFQLLAMTCLYMSIKLNEYKHLIIPGSRSSMDTILQLSRGFFTLEEMEKMEFDVLNVLGWHVHPPTPQVFVKHFLFFLGIEQHEIHDLSQFMVELSIMDYFFVSYKPSEVALASLLNAVDRLCPHGMAERISLPFQTKFLDLNSPAVSACRARLSLIYAQANEPTAIPAAEGSITPSSSTKTVHPAAETRTISPVSVMATPHVVPSSVSSSSFSAAHYGIQTTYVHSSWCA